MKYLIDTSALVRLLRLQTAERWHDEVRRGFVAICEPVITETLAIADAKNYQRMEYELRDAYPWVPVPDNAWSTVREVGEALATHSAHRGLSVADYLVVATALGHRLTILHDDNDFATVARFVPNVQQENISSA